MGTIAIDPSPPRSALPPGGSPQGDTAFMAWLKLFVARTNQLYRHGLLPEQHGERPMFEGPLVAEWQLLNHLIKWTIGWPFPDGQGPTHQHRIRFCAVQFALRRDELEAESDSYVAKQIAERLAREEHS